MSTSESKQGQDFCTVAHAYFPRTLNLVLHFADISNSMKPFRPRAELKARNFMRMRAYMFWTTDQNRENCQRTTSSFVGSRQASKEFLQLMPAKFVFLSKSISPIVGRHVATQQSPSVARNQQNLGVASSGGAPLMHRVSSAVLIPSAEWPEGHRLRDAIGLNLIYTCPSPTCTRTSCMTCSLHRRQKGTELNVGDSGHAMFRQGI